MDAPRVLKSFHDMVKFLREEAAHADEKKSKLARNLSDKKYYEGQRAILNRIAGMIEAGELVLCTCGADRTGPSAEAHSALCPSAASHELVEMDRAPGSDTVQRLVDGALDAEL